MSKDKRTNPFKNSTAAGQSVQAPALLTQWEWDLMGVVPAGEPLRFSACATRPNFFRPLLSALWSSHVSTGKPKHFEQVRQERDGFSRFARYLDEHKDGAVCSMGTLAQLTREILIDFRSWLRNHYSVETANKTYVRIAKHLVVLQGEKSPVPGAVPSNLEIPTRSLGGASASGSVQPYTFDVQTAIEQACKKEINEVLERLQRGKKLLAAGQDPRLFATDNTNHFNHAWEDKGNLLWYIVNVNGGRPLSKTGKVSDRARSYFLSETWQTTRKHQCDQFAGYGEALRHLYPFVADMSPFILLLTLKTGLNAESVLTLKRDCLKGVNGTKTGVEYTKTRGTHETMVRWFSHKGTSSPVGLIKTVLGITAHFLALADPKDQDKLFLAYGKGNHGKYAGKISAVSRANLLNILNGRRDYDKAGFFERHNLRDSARKIVRFDFRAARKTEATNAYLKHGSLANVSKKNLKHHGKSALNTTAFHYLTNDATHHVHTQAVRNAQDKLVQAARGAVILDVDAKSKKKITVLAKKLSESEEKIIALLSGEQDVFIAACRDFYNRPDDVPNTPCSDPWSCFSCANAVWTSRILPRLIRFKNFMEEQRKLLSPTDWHDKFVVPYSTIQNDILPRFQTRTIEWANIEARDIPFYVPTHLRNA